jgi:hypothetical protein
MVSGYSVTFIVASGNQDAVVAAARVAFNPTERINGKTIIRVHP